MTKSTGGSESSYHIRAVGRALDVLVAVGNLERADLTTVSQVAGLHPTTTLRMLESLRSRDFVRQRNGRYEIGPGAFEVGCRFLSGMSLAIEAQTLVQELAERVDETASLGILDEGEVLYVAIAHGQRELGIQSVPGRRHPAYCTALGKAMLADLPWEMVEEVLAAHPPAPLTPSTIVDPEHMRRELARIVTNRYAVDLEERVPGVTCVASPIRDQSGGVMAAISVSGPTMRVNPERLAALAEEVIAFADKASGVLGAPPSPRVTAQGVAR